MVNVLAGRCPFSHPPSVEFKSSVHQFQLCYNSNEKFPTLQLLACPTVFTNYLLTVSVSGCVPSRQCTVCLLELFHSKQLLGNQVEQIGHRVSWLETSQIGMEHARLRTSRLCTACSPCCPSGKRVQYPLLYHQSTEQLLSSILSMKPFYFIHNFVFRGGIEERQLPSCCTIVYCIMMHTVSYDS